MRNGKGGKSRSVFLGHTARSALWKYLEDRKRRRKELTGEKDLARIEALFCTGTSGHMSCVNLLHMIQGIGRRVDVEGANVHRWRHTFAINMLRNGCNPYALQEAAGHSDMETVRLISRSWIRTCAGRWPVRHPPISGDYSRPRGEPRSAPGDESALDRPSGSKQEKAHGMAYHAPYCNTHKAPTIDPG